METVGFEFTNPRNQKLTAIECVSSCSLKGSVFFHHGFGDCAERSAHVLTRLAKDGFAAFAHTAHGHGKSEPHEEHLRAYIGDAQHIVDDMEAFIANRLQQYPGLRSKPIFIMGQSLGGMACCHLALRAPSRYAGAVMLAPAIDVVYDATKRLMLLIGGLMALLIPYARVVSRPPPEQVVDDPAFVADWRTHPLVDRGKVRVASALALVKGMADARADAARVTLPLLLFHSPQDKMTHFQASVDFAHQVSSTDVTLYEVASPSHGLTACTQRHQILDKTVEWMDSIVSGLRTAEPGGLADGAGCGPRMAGHGKEHGDDVAGRDGGYVKRMFLHYPTDAAGPGC